MTKIDVSTWRECRIEEVFPEIARGDRLKKANRTKGDIPLVTAGYENYGIAEYIDIDKIQNKLYSGINVTIDMFGNVFLREHPFVCDDNIIVLSNEKSVEENLFITTVLDIQIGNKYGYNNQFRLKSIPDNKIMLPQTNDREIDLVTVKKYIEIYRKKADSRIQVLNSLETAEPKPLPIEAWREFLIENLFEKVNTKFIAGRKFSKVNDTSTIIDEEFSLPLTNAKHGDNGIMYYGRSEEWDSVTMSIDVVANGAIAVGDVYVQTQATAVLGDSFLMKIKEKYEKFETENVLLFLATVLEKSIKHKFSYDHKSTWTRVKKEYIKLPVTEEGQIDWYMMEDYIIDLKIKTNNQIESLSDLLV